MNTFPHTLHAPAREGFSNEPSGEAVLVGSTASGYPVLNKLFTFDGRIITFEKRHVLQANMLTFMAFYEANKEVPFYWTNEQDDIQYEVCFTKPPRCQIDGEKDKWRIGFEFRQYSPL